MTITDLPAGMSPGGYCDIECVVCDWTLPTGMWAGHGTPERPGCADYADAVTPLISAHIDETGHPVNVTLTTCWPGYDEQSTMTWMPRTGYWLSFVDRVDDVAVNLGVAIVHGTTMENAIRAAWRLGINPGGEVAGERIPDLRIIPEGLLFRLLTEPGDIAEVQISLAERTTP